MDILVSLYADFHVLSFTYIVDSVEVVGIILEA